MLLWNSCPYMTYPTFSFLLTVNCISPLTSISPHRTSTGTFPHSSRTPRSPRWNLVPFLDAPSLSHLPLFALPPVLWFVGLHFTLYAFHFRFCSCSTSAMQHQLSILFLLPLISSTVIGLYPLVRLSLFLICLSIPNSSWSMCSSI